MSLNTISLVITTYNGSRFLGEQLDSIASQTRIPDEIIILDDCSTDNTRELLLAYQSDHPELPIRLVFNAENVGWRRNFINGINETKHEFVLLCDQDDIWYPNKIEELEQQLCFNKQYKMIASNYELLNMRINGGLEKKQISHMCSTGEVVAQKITNDFYNVDRPGCTYIFKKSMFEECKQYWFDGLAHDKLLWQYAILDKTLGIYCKTLMMFRRHENNATGITNLDSSKKDRAAAAERNFKIVDLIYKDKIDTFNEVENKIIERYLAYEKSRIRNIKEPKIGRWIAHAFRYHSFFYSIKSFAKDVFISVAK